MTAVSDGPNFRMKNRDIKAKLCRPKHLRRSHAPKCRPFRRFKLYSRPRLPGRMSSHTLPSSATLLSVSHPRRTVLRPTNSHHTTSQSNKYDTWTECREQARNKRKCSKKIWSLTTISAKRKSMRSIWKIMRLYSRSKRQWSEDGGSRSASMSTKWKCATRRPASNSRKCSSSKSSRRSSNRFKTPP
jgi:hypothetical protein